MHLSNPNEWLVAYCHCILHLLVEFSIMFLPFFFDGKSWFISSFFIKFISASCVDDDPTFVRSMAWKIIKGWFTLRPLWNALIGLGIWNMYTTCARWATHGAYRCPILDIRCTRAPLYPMKYQAPKDDIILPMMMGMPRHRSHMGDIEQCWKDNQSC